ncbi:MAG: serine acetyltransferase, partial [Deltaproteobacteria bacterium]|nr:serine acetyltransferase [Deltaproteobacteria bacterium]
MDVSYKEDRCVSEVATTERFREEIPAIVDQLVLTCGREDCFDHVGQGP